MTADAGQAPLAESLAWIEEQIAALKESQHAQVLYAEQLQRQMAELADQANKSQAAVREIDPKLAPYKGIPEKLLAVNEDAERLRTAITNNKAELDNIVRTLRAEADNANQDRGSISKRLETAAAELGGVDVHRRSRLQAQVGQIAQTVTVMMERHAEIEGQVEQFGLRLERAIEVTHGLEARIAERVNAEQEERLAPVFERMQLLGEMVHRVEERIAEATAEQTLREDVMQEIGSWRDQHERIDSRLNDLEESARAAGGGSRPAQGRHHAPRRPARRHERARGRHPPRHLSRRRPSPRGVHGVQQDVGEAAPQADSDARTGATRDQIPCVPPAGGAVSTPLLPRGVLYKWAEVLPLTEKTPLLSLGEGDTPLVRSAFIERECGLDELWFKLESCNPTGSFKDRGMVMATAKAIEEGASAIMCASTGNTSASAAAYAARAGLESMIPGAEGQHRDGQDGPGGRIWGHDRGGRRQLR